jgi:hypothetical protein
MVQIDGQHYGDCSELQLTYYVMDDRKPHSSLLQHGDAK